MNPNDSTMPNDDKPGDYPAEPRVSLRDYAAVRFMATLLHDSVLPPGFDAQEQLYFAGCRAYECADALLRARAASEVVDD